MTLCDLPRFREPDINEDRLANELVGDSFPMECEVPYVVPLPPGMGSFSPMHLNVKFQVNLCADRDYTISDVMLLGERMPATPGSKEEVCEIQIELVGTVVPFWASHINQMITDHCSSLIEQKIDEHVRFS